MRKHYIDNLRWMVILLLIPYHAAQAWNTWGEANYLNFEGNKVPSSFITFFSAFIMPLLFLLAGVSTRYALKKRTYGQYITERVKRLVVPLAFGVLVLVPPMTYIADRYNCGYEGGFFEHYGVFFTKFTDLTGGDGGFSFGQFWFLLYLFVISLVAIGIIALVKKIRSGAEVHVPLWLILCLGLPLPIINDWLSVGGKSLVEFLYLFLIGYYVFASEEAQEKVEKFGVLFLLIGVTAGVASTYMFLWSGKVFGLANRIAKFVSEWFMILGLIGFGKKHLDFHGKAATYLSSRSFAFYSLHFTCLVVMQYLLAEPLKDSIVLLYAVPVIIAYGVTFAVSEIFMRVPVLRFLIGVKAK